MRLMTAIGLMPIPSVGLSSFLIAVVLLSPVRPAQSCSPQVWDAATDFSSTTNPNGAWSYGWSNPQGTSFNLWSGQATWGWCTFQVWGSGSWLGIGKNQSNSPLCTCNGLTRIPAQRIVMHPGNYAERAVLRWTAPTAGAFQVSAQFAGLDINAPTTVYITVSHNSAVLWSAAVTNSAPSSCSIPAPIAAAMPATNVTVSAGDTIDCLVGDGGNGNGNDSTLVEFTISCLAPQAPEYQTNSFAASLDINGVLGTPQTPALFVNVPFGATANLGLLSWNVGQPWDVGVGLAPLIPASAGAPTTSSGQIVNLNLTDPSFSLWFNFLLGPPWGPTTSLSLPFSFSVPTSLSAQMIVVAPSNPSGIALSQPVTFVQ